MSRLPAPASRSRRPDRLRHLALLFALLAASGCGYRLVGPQGLYRSDVKTVAVPTVGNETFYRADTERLTDALVKAVQAKTPYRIAPAADADTLLEVTITDVDRRTTSRNRRTAVPEEQLYVVRVDLTWKDLRTGKTLTRIEGLEQTSTQYATLGEGQFIASQSAAEQLADGIVEEIGGTW